MATQEVTVPDIGDFKDVDVIEVLVAPGDAINIDDSLITLVSGSLANRSTASRKFSFLFPTLEPMPT